MHSLLEMKRMGSDWKTVIFQTEDLPLDHLDNDEAILIIEAICRELSLLMPGDMFMPHEVAEVVLGSLDQTDFNDNKWRDIVEGNYDIVIAFSEIMFGAMREYGNINLVYLDEFHVKVQFQISPKENF